MGVVPTITKDSWPKQSEWLGRRVKVCYHYDTSAEFGGVIVRDDREEPHITLIRVDGECYPRYVLATECMWSFERS